MVTSETVLWSRDKCYFGLILKDGSDIHGFDKVTLVYFVLVNTKTDKVTLVTSETAFWYRNKCYFGPIYKDGCDAHPIFGPYVVSHATSFLVLFSLCAPNFEVLPPSLLTYVLNM